MVFVAVITSFGTRKKRINKADLFSHKALLDWTTMYGLPIYILTNCGSICRKFSSAWGAKPNLIIMNI